MQSRGAYMALSIITGLLMIVLGGLFLAQPGLSLASIIWLVGIFAIVYGVFLVIAGIAGRHDGGGWGIAVGVLAVIMGIVVLAWPAATSLAILYIIAAWAIISGIADIVGAFAGGISGGRRVWLVILGLIGIAVGIYFFVHPVSGILDAALGGRHLPGGARRVPHHRRVHEAAAAAGRLSRTGARRRRRGAAGSRTARGPAGTSSRPALCMRRHPRASPHRRRARPASLRPAQPSPASAASPRTAARRSLKPVASKIVWTSLTTSSGGKRSPSPSSSRISSRWSM